MALNRPVLMADGAVRSLHVLERIVHACGTSTTLEVVSWPSKAGSGSSIMTSVSMSYDCGLTEDEAYERIASLDEFAEYVDEAQAALDEVLPILTDEQAEQVTDAFPLWAAGVAYEAGDRRRHDGLLYRCVQAHTSQEGWEPPVVPALWVRTAKPDEVPEWVQPTGAQDAYAKGDRVRFEESVYESLIDGNVWSPAAYPAGWSLIEEGGAA